jgi:1-deoxy-D-xylulose 5-phosphate reductoisomerase
MLYQDLEAQVLGCVAADRARLLERLIASFEPETAVESAWLDLAQARQRSVQDGGVEMVRGEQALDKVRAKIVTMGVASNQ